MPAVRVTSVWRVSYTDTFITTWCMYTDAMPSETVYFPADLHREVLDRAEKTDQNLSQVVQGLVRESINAEGDD